jgi:uncharacterized membrane protein
MRRDNPTPGSDNAPVNESISISPARTSLRWQGLDIARGVALAAMVIYHAAWDLSFLNLITTEVVTDPAWRWFARTIAGSFLFLSGIALVLAHRNGVRREAFLRRLAKIAGAALAVTVVTFVVFPDSYIFFGILHAIAASSVIALPFLRVPYWLTLLVAGLFMAAPWLLTSPALDAPWLDWLGLGQAVPRTNDYIPIFPWTGLVLAGVAAARSPLIKPRLLPPSASGASGVMTRWLAIAGRWSLPIYLVHQPILFGAFSALLAVTGPNPQAEARPFLRECQAGCLRANDNESVCRRTCQCMVESMRREGLWTDILADRLKPEDQTRVSRMAQQCLSRQPAGAPS